MWTVAFWKDLSERVAATFLEGFLAVFGIGQSDLLHVDWRGALLAGAGVAVLSLVKGILAGLTGDKLTASFIKPAIK